MSLYGAIAGARAILSGAYRLVTAAGRVVTAAGTGQGVISASRHDLNPTQLQNLRRFEDKLSTGASKTAIYDKPGGVRVFRAEVPGNVPGSRAIYEKQVDTQGRTTGYIKTTIAPDGKVVHIKDKFNK
jgi:hypothetical protein